MLGISEENARALYAAVVQQRQHWAVMINTMMGFAVTINAGVWAYLFAEYIRSGGSRPAFILTGGAISAITIVGWRLYTRYLDHNVARLYSDILYYEMILGVPDDMGISNYLINEDPKAKEMLINKTLSSAEKVKAIKCLYEEKQLGSRGHHIFETLSYVYIVILIVIEIIALLGCWTAIRFSSLQDWINDFAYFACLVITIVCLLVLRCRKWR